MVPLAHLELKLLCALLPKPRELLHPDLPLSPSPVPCPSLGHVRRQDLETLRVNDITNVNGNANGVGSGMSEQHLCADDRT